MALADAAPPSDLRKIIFVPGLPQWTVAGAETNPPESTLSHALRHELRSLVNFDWRAEIGKIKTYSLLRRGAFGKEFSDKFDTFLRKQTGRFRSDDKVGVVCYSLGGGGFYHWVTRQETEAKMISRIGLVITIGSPYQCERGEILLKTASGPLLLTDIKEPGLNPADVLDTLPEGMLKVLLAEMDATILPGDSSFSEVLTSKSNTNKQFEQIVIPGAEHDTICSECETNGVLGHILAWLGRDS